MMIKVTEEKGGQVRETSSAVPPSLHHPGFTKGLNWGQLTRADISWLASKSLYDPG